MDILTTIHPWLGYLVLAGIAAAAVMAFSYGKASREFDPRLAVAAMVLLDIQVLLGAIIYVVESGWRAGWLVAYAHPILALAALGVGHAALGRARDRQMVDDAWRLLGRGLTVVVVLVVATVGIASAA